MKTLAALALVAVVCAPLPADAQGARIEFGSIREALFSLDLSPNVTRREQDGWLIYTDESGLASWVFTPVDHEAHPSLVKRVIYQRDGAWFTETAIMCGADKPACDSLYQSYQQLDAEMREELGKVG